MNKETIEYYQFASRKEWIEKLQEAPSASLVKTRQLGQGKTSRYVPLGIQEALSDMFFRECDLIENVLEVYNNQAVVRVKLSILPNYPNAEHRIISGIGAKVISKAGNSLEYGAPSSQAAAKSNALTNFGNIFGRNLNRDFSDGFSFIKKKEEGKDDTTN